MPDPRHPPEDLSSELTALRQEIARLNRHKFIRVQNSLWRLLGQQFLRGVAMGLGTVVGATIVVSIAAYALAQIDFIPIIGDWATTIAEEIESNRGEPAR